ncbi:hypothetical protein BDV32DRAFT_154093 [Aspergillus pseudonomiae]|uniref:Uncharacterized protein n=1 Tax=Aspergillus pseudonomiae TaxID=1506151 RepID=A0A5N6HMD5_9EURO|nr:uncharacterized protein BDV37DRAFT_219397 [Aspergillus pseudonomiae]KAB8255586.1 hypothetical protein BDV32DRAFT_154093 [Aspergillus pseudonomiae]KAE8399840.1 hypothetical protein BDV37DRAFT_219397 [Aspergillus pseudonomiae]
METQIKTSRLRQSCRFCRGRKIRCSGGRICKACRDRNINCVYGPEARKGRPKRKGTEDKCTLNPGVSKRDRKQSISLVNTAVSGVLSDDSVVHASVALEKVHTLGNDLEQMFDDYFISKTGSESNLLQLSMSSFQRRQQQSYTYSHPTHHQVNYEGLLSSIAQEMVEMLLLRVGSLRCGQPENNRTFFIATLVADTTPSMFDPPQYHNPLTALGKHRILQLIDMWFSVHPLSPLVSKTLLTSEVKDGTVDEALLAIILADAYHVLSGDSEQHGAIRDESQKLSEFASIQIKQRQLPLGDTEALSTVQALFLIGWRELCLGHARRATCIVGYTCYMASRLEKTWKNADMKSVKLNGVEIDLVKKEVLQNVHWLCLTTTTWAFMQFDQALALFGPDEIPDFPCRDETTSALIRLDQASDNISTLPAQIQALRYLWPLSHISSTVSHIYILYLNMPAKGVPKASWQEQHIHQLYDLLQSCADFPTLSAKIRDILLQAVQAVESQTTTLPSQLYLLTAYHVIITHMLFSQNKTDQKSLRISSTIINAFCQSASALLALSYRSLDPSKGIMLEQREGGMAFINMLVLGLDTCSRALVHIYDHLSRGLIDSQKENTAIKQQLANYADKFHQICKSDAVSRCGTVMRPVKKRLKWAKLAFQHLQMPPEPHLEGLLLDLPFSTDRPGDMPSSDIVPDALLVNQQPISGTTDPFFVVDDPIINTLLSLPGITDAHEELYQDYTCLQPSKPSIGSEQDLLYTPNPTSLLPSDGESLELVYRGARGSPLSLVNTDGRPDELNSTPSDMTEFMYNDTVNFTPPEQTLDNDLLSQLLSNPDDNLGPLCGK